MNAVLESIRSQYRHYGRWELSADDVRTLLGIDHAEFYRRIYEEAMGGNRMVDVSMTTARFEQRDVGELVTLLELFVGPEAERELERAGVFFSHETRFEITSRLLRNAGEAAAEHTVDRPAFEAMLDLLGSYRRARGRYLDEHFSVADLIAATAAGFVRETGFGEPDLAEANVRDLLEHYFTRHVLERETVLAGVCVKLFEIAVEAGFARRPEDEWAEEQRERRARQERNRAWFGGGAGAGDRGGAGGSGAGSGGGHSRGAGDAAARAENPLRWARGVMELADEPISLRGLKSRYKTLMKRFHPDVNPNGLRACQRINEAYSLLLASAVETP